jgi:hypothetical protein
MGAADKDGNEQINCLTAEIRFDLQDITHKNPDKIGYGHENNAETDEGQIPLTIVDPFPFAHLADLRRNG